MEALKAAGLNKGDLVGICAPSNAVEHRRDEFEKARERFEEATGLRTLVAPNVFRKHYYSAGTPEERLSDFHSLFENDEVKAIVFAAGGNTAIDLLPGLDFDLIARNPKIVAGISDATTLLSSMTVKTGLITFLGFEFLEFAHRDMNYTVESIQKNWFEGGKGLLEANPNWEEFDGIPTSYPGTWQTIREGEASGRLLGGNYQSFFQLLNTDFGYDFSGSILFFETYRLAKRQIHKALMQFELHGVLEKINGMVVGYCLESDDPEILGNEQPLAETILEVVDDYDFPIMQIGEIGHRVENALQPIGAQVRMNAGALEFEILERIVD